MVTKREVLDLVASGASYDEVGARLAIAPGLAFMIATGLPADGSDALAPEDRERPGFVATSTQHLANPAPVYNPVNRDEVQRWIDRRVRADEQMRSAAARDQPVPPPLGDPGDDADVGAVLARDHAHFHKLANELEVLPGVKDGGAPDQVERRAKIVAAIRAALARHEAAEEAHLWPAVRRSLQGGDAIADHAQSQEQQARDTLDALASVQPASERFDDLATQLGHRLRAHVAFEDWVVLALRDALGAQQRVAIGEQVSTAERSGSGSS